MAVLVLAFAWSKVDAQPAEKPVKQIMQNKLAHANAILGAVAVTDFERVQLNAAALLAFTQQAEWKVMHEPAYLSYSGHFRDALEQMDNGAQKKNLDAVTVGYLQMTMACVNCHKYVRDRLKAQAPALDATRLAALAGDRMAQEDRR